MFIFINRNIKNVLHPTLDSIWIVSHSRSGMAPLSVC